MVFSIVVPVYNVEKYIDECILSVLNQTYSKWELILVDDGSTDRSGAICKEYAERDNRIKLFTKENSGQADSRNVGVKQVIGDYLLFLDSDDYIAYDALQRFYEECRKWNMPDIILSEGMYEICGNRIEECRHWNADDYLGMSGRDTLLKTMDSAPNWSPCDKCYRVNFWKEKNFMFPKHRLAEDFALIDKVVLEAQCVTMITSFYYYRRFRENATMSPRNKKLKHDELLNLLDWEKFFNEKKLDDELVTAFRRTFAGLYCHDILGNMFLFDKKEKMEVLRMTRQLLFYLDYVEGKEEKIVSLMVKVIGLKLTCSLLGYIKRYRIQKERKGI